jgi:hypothetical protein
MQATRKMNRLTGSGSLNLLKWQRGKQTISNITKELMAQLRSREKLAYYWIDKSRGSNYIVYSTFSVKGQNN